MAPYQPFIDADTKPSDLKAPSPPYTAYLGANSPNSSPSSSSTPSPPSASPDSSPPLKHESPPPLYTSRPSTTRSSRRSQPTTILGAIDENGVGMAPDVPLRSARRTPSTNATRAFFTALFPPSSAPSNRDPETDYNEVTGPRGEKFADVRQNRRNGGRSGSRRCGWRLLACLGLVLVIIAALVAIGVVVGLKRMSSHKGSSASSSADNGTTTVTGFPVGSYTVITFLATISSLCTPNPSTWRCYPYQTYNDSHTGAQTTLNWIISGTNDSKGVVAYSIAPSANPFALPFNSSTLTLANPGTADEAWWFETMMDKVVVPSTPITSDGASAQCIYRGSRLSARLYTKKPRSYPASLGTSMPGEGEWPYAVEIEQQSSDVPSCYEVKNGVPGASVSIGQLSGGQGADCGCEYQNYGT